jgi:Protein of unknown function (DUF1207)
MRSKSRLADCGIMPMQRIRVRLSVTLIALLLGLFCLLSPAQNVTAAASEDAFIAGYATAVLERDFKVRAPSLRVTEGLLTVAEQDLAGADREEVLRTLSGIRGVLRVAVRSADPAAPGSASSISLQAPAADRGPNTVGAASDLLPAGWLPEGHLFRPLLADPRWPHFSASYNYHINDPVIRSAGTVSFGETIPLYRTDAPIAGQVEFGLQAGVFAIFDLEAQSKDLDNADYYVAAMAAYRTGNVSALGRLFHMSSHLGDEYLLRTKVERVNLSYEGVDLNLSYDLPFGFRLYGGGRVLFDQEPSDLKRFGTQGGVEFRSPQTFWGGRIRPIAAVDVQNHQENDWRADLSARAGIQFESVRVLGRNLQLLVQYFNGHSPDGQFYKEKIEYIGLGVHFNF